MSTPAGPPAPSGAGKRWLLLAAGALALASTGLVAWRRAGAQPGAGGAARAERVHEPSVVELEPFVLNLADPTGDRFVKLTLRLVLDRREIARRAAQGLAAARLRDRLFTLLARKRASELTSAEGKERLRAELSAEAETLLADAPFHEEADPAPARVLDLFFTEFLVQ